MIMIMMDLPPLKYSSTSTQQLHVSALYTVRSTRSSTN